MSSMTAALDQLIDAFLSEQLDFTAFERSFMEKWAAADLSPTELGGYEEAYEIVYMGSAGPPRAVDRAVGILSEEEARTRLASFRRRSKGDLPDRS
jgi:aromatic ring hydroxylase